MTRGEGARATRAVVFPRASEACEKRQVRGRDEKRSARAKLEIIEIFYARSKYSSPASPAPRRALNLPHPHAKISLAIGCCPYAAFHDGGYRPPDARRSVAHFSSTFSSAATRISTPALEPEPEHTRDGVRHRRRVLRVVLRARGDERDGGDVMRRVARASATTAEARGRRLRELFFGRRWFPTPPPPPLVFRCAIPAATHRSSGTSDAVTC